MKKFLSLFLAVMVFFSINYGISEEYQIVNTGTFEYEIEKHWAHKQDEKGNLYYYNGEIGDATNGYYFIKENNLKFLSSEKDDVLSMMLEGIRENGVLEKNKVFEKIFTYQEYRVLIGNHAFDNETYGRFYTTVVLVAGNDNNLLSVLYTKKENVSSKKDVIAQGEFILSRLKINGMWAEKEYLDVFQEPTGTYYLELPEIEGTFSNSATQNSDLYVELFITNEKKIHFKLYEYGENGYLVSEYRKVNYNFEVRDDNKKTTKLIGTIKADSDELTLDAANSKKLHKLLLTNNSLSIYIVNSRHKTTTYLFKLEPLIGYEEAYQKLMEK